MASLAMAGVGGFLALVGTQVLHLRKGIGLFLGWHSNGVMLLDLRGEVLPMWVVLAKFGVGAGIFWCAVGLYRLEPEAYRRMRGILPTLAAFLLMVHVSVPRIDEIFMYAARMIGVALCMGLWWYLGGDLPRRVFEAGGRIQALVVDAYCPLCGRREDVERASRQCGECGMPTMVRMELQDFAAALCDRWENLRRDAGE